ANATGTTISYQWLDCNNGNAPISGETSQTFTATSIGSYAVIITDSACPISDTSSCYDVNSLSIGELDSALQVSLYPNPVEDNLTVILGNNYNDIQLEIYSLTGQLLRKINESNRLEFKVNISDLSSGMYIVKLNAAGKIYTSRILKN
ncbi:T9SS type A sorting domain-containing protein, partial [Winogradskyella sp.]|nr:T9SS type A sorting domain-containing protein [Winogradskyella sp.]